MPPWGKNREQTCDAGCSWAESYRRQRGAAAQAEGRRRSWGARAGTSTVMAGM